MVIPPMRIILAVLILALSSLAAAQTTPDVFPVSMGATKATTTTLHQVPVVGAQAVLLRVTGDEAVYTFWPTTSASSMATVTGTATAITAGRVYRVAVSTIAPFETGMALEIRETGTGLVKARGICQGVPGYNFKDAVSTSPYVAGTITFVTTYAPEDGGIVSTDTVHPMQPYAVVSSSTEAAGGSGVMVGLPVGTEIKVGEAQSMRVPAWAQSSGVVAFRCIDETDVILSASQLFTGP